MKTLHLAVTAVLALTVVSTSGCARIARKMAEQQATARAVQAKELADTLARSPLCSSDIECHRMMGNAQVWISTKTRFNFAIANDSMVRSYTDGMEYWYEVARTPVGGGRSRLILNTNNNTSMGLAEEFSRFVQN
jgi:hypothetical protein